MSLARCIQCRVTMTHQDFDQHDCTAIHPCDKCEEPVPVAEHLGNDRPDGTSEYLCPDCYVTDPHGNFRTPECYLPTFSPCRQGFHALLPNGGSAVWFAEGTGFYDEPTLCVFMAVDEEWIQPLLETPCGSLEEARTALSAAYLAVVAS